MNAVAHSIIPDPNSDSVVPRPVYYFDNDSRLDMDRLRQIFLGRIMEQVKM